METTLIQVLAASGVTVYCRLDLTGISMSWASGETSMTTPVSRTDSVPWTTVKSVFTIPTATVTFPLRCSQVVFSATARVRLTEPASPEVWAGTIHGESLVAVQALLALKEMTGEAASFPTLMVVPTMFRASSASFSSDLQETAASPTRAATASNTYFFISK